jgi:hypothetical protein
VVCVGHILGVSGLCRRPAVTMASGRIFPPQTKACVLNRVRGNWGYHNASFSAPAGYYPEAR